MEVEEKNSEIPNSNDGSIKSKRVRKVCKFTATYADKSNQSDSSGNDSCELSEDEWKMSSKSKSKSGGKTTTKQTLKMILQEKTRKLRQLGKQNNQTIENEPKIQSESINCTNVESKPEINLLDKKEIKEIKPSIIDEKPLIIDEIKCCDSGIKRELVVNSDSPVIKDEKNKSEDSKIIIKDEKKKPDLKSNEEMNHKNQPSQPIVIEYSMTNSVNCNDQCERIQTAKTDAPVGAFTLNTKFSNAPSNGNSVASLTNFLNVSKRNTLNTPPINRRKISKSEPIVSPLQRTSIGSPRNTTPTTRPNSVQRNKCVPSRTRKTVTPRQNNSFLSTNKLMNNNFGILNSRNTTLSKEVTRSQFHAIDLQAGDSVSANSVLNKLSNISPNGTVIRTGTGSVTITPRKVVNERPPVQRKLFKNEIEGTISGRHIGGALRYVVNLANGTFIPLSDVQVEKLREQHRGVLPIKLRIPVPSDVADKIEPSFLIED